MKPTKPTGLLLRFALEEKQELRMHVWVDVWLCEDCETRAVIPRRVKDPVRAPLCCPNGDCPSWDPRTDNAEPSDDQAQEQE